MGRQTLHTLELAAAIIGQTTLLAAAWSFLGAIFAYDPIVVPDYLADLMSSWPTETTWVVTLLATILSVTTTTYLSIAFKEALRRRMRESISLIHLSTGVALARCSFLVNFRHLIPTLVTLAVFGVSKLLVSSWSALLTPTRVTWSVDASGWELDLTGSWFESTLQQELVLSGAALGDVYIFKVETWPFIPGLVRGNSTQIISLDGVLSGIAAAESSFGKPGIFDFNGAKYNVSTGGILPAAPGYGGITDAVSNNNTGLAFSGGRVPTHLNISFPDGRTRQGLQDSFTLVQQGLTANVTCQQTNGTASNLNYNSSFIPIPIPLANGTTDYWLWAWNITANCSEGIPSQQQYVTRSNSSTLPQGSTSGLISSLVCPYPLLQTGFSWEHFTVATNASWRYNFLPLTVCAINPLVTTSLVTYANGAINTSVISSQSLGNSNTNLTQFLAAIVDYQARTTQGLTTNSIGDALYSIYISASGSNSTSPQDVTNFLTRELEQYWLGVIEFSGTFLRSAFSVDPSTIPIEARISLSGQQTVTTMGWYPRPAIWAYTVLPITIVALMMYAAVAYTVWQAVMELGQRSRFTTFDPSNPIHLIMVSSARERDAKDNLDAALAGFERGGIGHNEGVRVELTEVPGVEHGPERKRFRATSFETSPQ